MFDEILKIKEMIDLVIRESNGLTHRGLVAEMQYISKTIESKVDSQIEEMASAYERYDDAIIVGAE